MDYKKLPYRQGVGMMIINKHKQVFVGQRIDTKIDAWQMPQGGIDLGETPSKAALREMHEELGTANAKILAETKNWYTYNVPKFLVPKLWDGRYCGQRQKWFLIEFLGEDSEIDIDTEFREFSEWRWAEIEELSNIIIPFKRKLYSAVIDEFSNLLTKA